MMIELIIICVSILAIIALYIGRMKSDEGQSKILPTPFLVKMDIVIFDFVKFIFKLHALLISNVGSFLKEVPHKIVHSIHQTFHVMAQKSSEWVDVVKKKTHSK